MNVLMFDLIKVYETWHMDMTGQCI